MKTLQIAEELLLPHDAATQKLAFIGRTGSGKTHAAGKMAEEMLAAGIQVIILDPVGVWYGLRMKTDGTPGYSIPIFGGLKGDIPLEPTGGALVADLVVDRGISMVIDVSQFESDADKSRFAAAFADRFYFRKKASPSAVHVIIDEAQEFVPQNPNHGEERMLHAFVRICKLGRNFGIGVSLISQRPQEVSKKALNQTECLFAFQMNGPQERKAIELWMNEKGIDTGIAGQLPALKVGTCFAWSPQWLGISALIHILPKRTMNSSSTPTTGAPAKKLELAPIDLAKLADKMRETIERAKADDPKHLRSEVARLEALLKKAAVQPAPPAPKRVEVPVLTPADLVQVRAAVALINRGEEKFGVILANIEQRVAKFKAGVSPTVDTKGVEVHMLKLPVASENIISIRRFEVSSDTTPDASQLKILGVVAMLNGRGIDVNRESVARWLDIHPNGGRYGTNLLVLRQDGYLDGFMLTEKGAAIAPAMETGYQAALLPLDGNERKIMEHLFSGQRHTRDSLAEAMGIHPNGGRYGTGLVRLRTMGLIPERGEIYLTEAAGR